MSSPTPPLPPETKVLYLKKDDFTALLGPVREVLSRQMRTRVLKSVPILASLSDADLDVVGNAMRVQQVDACLFVMWVRMGDFACVRVCVCHRYKQKRYTPYSYIHLYPAHSP